MTDDDFDPAQFNLANCLDDTGLPTPLGRKLLRNMASQIEAVLVGHPDNTDAGCRIDLNRHDCCHTCGDVETMLRAVLADYSNDSVLLASCDEQSIGQPAGADGWREMQPHGLQSDDGDLI